MLLPRHVGCGHREGHIPGQKLPSQWTSLGKEAHGIQSHSLALVWFLQEQAVEPETRHLKSNHSKDTAQKVKQERPEADGGMQGRQGREKEGSKGQVVPDLSSATINRDLHKFLSFI